MIRYFPPTKTTYAAADLMQQKLSRALLDYKNGAFLPSSGEEPPSMSILAYEMFPTYTLGRRQKKDVSEALSASISKNVSNSSSKAYGQYEIVSTLRGGHTTFHGPGQLVLYPILDLRRLNIKVREYVCILEKSIVHVLQNQYNIGAEQRPGAGLNGVWIANANKKVASVGVHVRRNVTSHGLALNVDMDPFWFNQIVPCNLPESEMVSMAQFTSQKPQLNVVSDQLVKELGVRLGAAVETSTLI